MRKEIMSQLPINKKIVGGVIGIIIGGIVLVNTIYAVDQSERGVVLRNGAIIHTADPGLGFKVPFIDKVIKIDTQVHKDTLTHLDTYSADKQLAHIEVNINYQAAPDHVDTLYSNFTDVQNMVFRTLDPIATQQTKIVFGRYNADEAIQYRQKLNDDIRDSIFKVMKEYPTINIEDVQVVDIKFSSTYETSIEERMLAEVEVLKLKQNAQREKVQAEIVETQANAKADAIRSVAKAEADAIEFRGKAEAAAIEARSKALNDNPNVVELIKAEKWNGVLPTTMLPGNGVPMVGIK